MEELTKWLLEQAPVVVVMGTGLWWTVKRLSKAEEDKQKMAEDIIKITILWQNTGEDLTEDAEEFQKEVIDILKDIKRMIEK